MKKVILLFVLFVYSFSFAQDNYKYVIVPKKFSFFKEENKYNLNVITKSFFEKEGFEVYFDTDEFPKELAENRCLALFVNPTDEINMFSTKVVVELKDCYNKVLYMRGTGVSKQKDFQKSYTEAFRIALNALKGHLKVKYSSVELVEEVEEISKANFSPKSDTVIDESELSAIATGTGYNLVNKNQERVFILQKTSLENVFITKKNIFHGVFIKKNNEYFFEYYESEKLFSEKVNVKF